MSLSKRIRKLERAKYESFSSPLVIVKSKDKDTLGYTCKGRTWLLNDFDNDLDLLLENVERTVKSPVIILNPVGQEELCH